MSQSLILSTTGTSLLHATKANKSLIQRTAGDTESTISDADRQELEYFMPEMQNLLLEKAEICSAELNAITRIFGHFSLSPNGSNHVLVGTDTFQSMLTTKVLAEYLRNQTGATVLDSIHQKELNGVYVEGFNKSIRRLIDRLLGSGGILNGYPPSSGYKVIANTTGGIKPLASVIESLSPLFASHVVSVFNGSQELLVRKPLLLDASFISQFPEDCVLLSQQEPIPKHYISKDFPHNNLEEIGDNHVTFSDLALALYIKNKPNISLNKIKLPFIKFAPSFLDDVKGLDNKQTLELFEAIGKISYILIDGNGNLAGAKNAPLVYKDYFGENVGHFRVGIQMRVVTKRDKNGVLTLHHYGTHKYTESKAASL